MPCYSPITIYHRKVKTTGIVYKGGKKVFVPGLRRVYQLVPCGHCLGCLRVRQMQYAFRAEWECLDPSNVSQYFVTLTFAPEFLPEDNELDKKHVQDYIRRLRNYVPGVRVRYMACGEHGELYGRAHYHLLLWFDDFVSPSVIGKAWPFGIVDVQDVIPERCGYVAKYSTKQLSDNSDNWDVPPFLLISNSVGFYFLERHGDYCIKGRYNAWLNQSGYPVLLPRVFMERLFPPSDKIHLESRFLSPAAAAAAPFFGDRVALKCKTHFSYEQHVSLSAVKERVSAPVFQDVLLLRNSWKSFNLQNQIRNRVSYETGRY